MALIAAMVAARSYAKPGATLPVIGTEPWGLYRMAMVSAAVSQGSSFGCCLKSVNQEQPARRPTSETRDARCEMRRMIPAFRIPHVGSRRSSGLIPHLHRPVLLEDVRDVARFLRSRVHPD